LHTFGKFVAKGGKRPHIKKDNFPNKQFVSIIIKNVHIFTSFEKQPWLQKGFSFNLKKYNDTQVGLVNLTSSTSKKT
jgi:hypothetical protein